MFEQRGELTPEQRAKIEATLALAAAGKSTSPALDASFGRPTGGALRTGPAENTGWAIGPNIEDPYRYEFQRDALAPDQRAAWDEEKKRREGMGLDWATQAKEAARKEEAARKMREWETMGTERLMSPEVEAALKASAMGQGESVAQLQMKEAYAQAMRDQLAFAGLAKGSQMARSGALQTAQTNIGQQQSALARQGGLLRAEEMQQARAQLLGAASAQSQIDANQRALAAQMSGHYYGAQFAPEDAAMNRRMQAYGLAQQVEQARIQREFEREQAEANRPWQLGGAALSAGGAVASSLLSGPLAAAKTVPQALAPMVAPAMQLTMPQVGQGYGYRRSW